MFGRDDPLCGYNYTDACKSLRAGLRRLSNTNDTLFICEGIYDGPDNSLLPINHHPYLMMTNCPSDNSLPILKGNANAFLFDIYNSSVTFKNVTVIASQPYSIHVSDMSLLIFSHVTFTDINTNGSLISSFSSSLTFQWCQFVSLYGTSSKFYFVDSVVTFDHCTFKNNTMSLGDGSRTLQRCHTNKSDSIHKD